MRAVLYLRQSLDRTGEGAAVDRQRDACLRLCEHRGFDVINEYVDNSVSASSSKPRPAYTRMVAEVRAGKADVVVVWDLDRLTRRPLEVEDWITLHERHGVNLVTISENVDLATDNGRMFLRIKAAVARSEVERKGARQRAAAAQRTEQGKPPSGPRGFGYSKDGMSIVETEAAVIRQSFDLLLSGGTVRSVARHLNDSGLRTNRGNEWKPYAVRSLLLNPRYAALTWSPGPRDHREITGKGSWPAIVEEETWYAVRDLLDNPARRTVTSTRRAYLLSGLALCGRCGTPVGAGGNTRGVRVYRCKASAHLSRAQAPVDEYVTALVVARLSRPDAAQLLVDTERPDADALRSQAITVRSRLSSVADLVADGTLTTVEARTTVSRLRAELVALEEKMAHAGRGDVLGPLVEASDVAAAWDSLDLDRQRAVVSTLMEVTLLPAGRGARGFDPVTVRAVPR